MRSSKGGHVNVSVTTRDEAFEGDIDVEVRSAIGTLELYREKPEACPIGAGPPSSSRFGEEVGEAGFGCLSQGAIFGWTCGEEFGLEDTFAATR